MGSGSVHNGVHANLLNPAKSKEVYVSKSEILLH